MATDDSSEVTLTPLQAAEGEVKFRNLDRVLARAMRFLSEADRPPGWKRPISFRVIC